MQILGIWKLDLEFENLQLEILELLTLELEISEFLNMEFEN